MSSNSPERETDPAEINALASAVMKRGMALMQRPTRETINAALECFDEALALRQRLPLEEAPSHRYALAACWLNRAEALMLLGGAPQIEASLDAFDEAIAFLQALPFDADPLYPRRLAIAHQNRGFALSALAPPRLEAAAAAFTHAIGILDHPAAAAIDDRPLLLAAAWVNLARIRTMLKDATIQDVQDAAITALECIAGVEENELGAADIGLQARHLLCQALARVLPSVQAGNTTGLHAVHAATDAVDEGLSLVRAWEVREVDRFREVAADLLRFGARVYHAFQPQFLAEFLEEQLDPRRSSEAYVNSPQIRLAAQDVLSLTASEHIAE